METVQHDRPYLAKLIEREAKRKKRRAIWGKAITNQISLWLVNFLNAWFFMLAVGIAHAVWIPTLPTIGYWWAVLLVNLVKGVFSAARFDKKGGES